MFDIKQASTVWSEEADKIQQNFKLIDKLLPKTLNYLGDAELTRNSLNISERFTGKIISYIVNGVFINEQYLGTLFTNNVFGLDSNWQQIGSGSGSGGSSYTHPATHPASMIVQTTLLRFVSDAEKSTWNAKSTFSGAYADLTGKPTLFNGNYNSLTNKLVFKTINGNSVLGSGDIVISGGGTSTPETATTIGNLINSSSSKGTPADGDMFSIRDSVTGLLQKLPFLALKGTLKPYFDQFYSYDFKTINGNSIIGNGDIVISGPETATTIGNLINSSSSKGTPADADMFSIRDSVTGLLQKLPFLALKGTLKPYFDQFYSYDFKTINGNSIIGNGDITISGPETATSMGVLINTATEKTTPADADMFSIRDSVTGFLQKLPFSNLKTSLKTYFDTIYNNYTHPTNHPASVITQDSSNRFVSDIEKTTWTGKSNFSGAYSDLSGKPSFKTINGNSITGTGNIEIEGGGGTSTPETATSIGALINSSTDKSAPVDADMFAIRDSVTGFLQKVSFSNLKKVFKDYFDTLYNNYTHPTNHPASIITQDTNNRLVSDTEKATWNSKSNFSGAYADLSGKPSFKTINGQSIIGNGDIVISGGETSTPETATSMGVLINTATEKTTPADADMFSIRDSVSGFLQKLSFSSLKTILKTYFDTLYNNYTHPANHPASIITQDTNNRLVSDTEKATWNSKSNFSGAYADLSGKPSIPTSLSQLIEDSTHKHITETEKGNIPKNTALVQDFSQAGITIDFAAYDIQEDGGFDSNLAITTGNKDITISNPFLNKVVTILLPKISEGTVIRLPEGCKKLTGDYNDTLQNIIMIHCTKTSPARYLYTISQIQA